MRTITIGVSKPRRVKLGAEAIKFWMDSDFSHTYVRMPITSLNREVVYHAAHGMVHFISYEHFLEENVTTYEVNIEVSEELYQKLLSKCIDLAGIAYGYSELAKILAYDIAYKLDIKLLTYNSRGYICSELVAEFLEEALLIQFNKPKHLVTPKDIYLIIREIG